MRITASSLFRAEKCPASASLPQFRHLTLASERGTEMHAEKEAELPEGAEMAFAYDLASGRVRFLGQGKKREYGELLPTEIAGTMDKVLVEPDRVVVRDYKSGWGNGIAPPAKNLQLGFGAVCAAEHYGKDVARVELEFLDREAVVSADLDAFDLASVRERLRSLWGRAARRNPDAVIGDHCSMCPCIQSCPAHLNLASAVAGQSLTAALPTEGLTAETVAKGWRNLKALKRVLGEAERSYRGFAQLWTVDLGDGKFLGERMKEREELDGRVVRQVLRDLHGEQVADLAVELSATKAALERAIETVAQKGKKAGLVREALKAIDDANGIVTKKTLTVDEYGGE